MCRHPIRDGKQLPASILEGLPMLMGGGILSCYMLLYLQSRHILGALCTFVERKWIPVNIQNV